MVGSCATVLGQVVRVVKTLLIQSSLKRGSGQSFTRDQMEQSFASLPIRLKPHKMDYGPVCEDNCVAWNRVSGSFVIDASVCKAHLS